VYVKEPDSFKPSCSPTLHRSNIKRKRRRREGGVKIKGGRRGRRRRGGRVTWLEQREKEF